MSKKIVALLSVLVLSVTASFTTGCGDEKSDSGSSSSSSEGSKTSSSGSSETIEMTSNSFDPSEFDAKVGQEITWNNSDSIAHTVTADSGADFDSGNMNPGDKFSFTPTEAGTIKYICQIHPGMEGTINVQ